MINKEEAQKLYRELHKDKQAEQDKLLVDIEARIKDAIKEGKESIVLTCKLSDYVKNPILKGGFAIREIRKSEFDTYGTFQTIITGWAE